MSGYAPGAVDGSELLPLMAMVRQGELSEDVQRLFRKHAHCAPKKEPVVLKEELPGLLAELRYLAPTVASKATKASMTMKELQELLWACAMEAAEVVGCVRGERLALKDRFLVMTTIGEGATGKVLLAKDRQSEQRRAVKMVYKCVENPKQLQVQEQSYQRELRALSAMDHPHILRLHQHFEDEEGWYLVLDYCNCGDLSRLMEDYKEEGHACPMTGLTPMPLPFSLKVIYQVLLALAHMHKRKIMHLDVKGQNIMFQVSYTDTILPHEQAAHPAPSRVLKEPHVVLSDFGTALETSSTLSSPIGTCAFMAPEVWNSTLSPFADIWSLGIVFFQLLSGQMPFQPPNIIDLAKEYWLMEPLPPWFQVPYTAPQCRELCTAMLRIENRPSAQELLNQPLFTELKGDEEKPASLPPQYAERLVAFAEGDVLQKCMRMRLARAWQSNQMPSFRRLFVALADGSGRLPLPRLAAAVTAALAEQSGSAAVAQRRAAALEALAEAGDVGFTHFVAALADLANPKYENFLLRSFEQVDHDDDGLVGLEGLAELLAADPKRHAVLLQELMVALTGHASPGARFEARHFLRHLRRGPPGGPEGEAPEAPDGGGCDGFFQRFAGTLLDQAVQER